MLDKITQEQKDLAATEGYDDYMNGDPADWSATRVFYRAMGHNRWQDYENWDAVWNAYMDGYEAAAKEGRAKVGQFTHLRVEAVLDDDTLVTFIVNHDDLTHVVSLAGSRKYAMEALLRFRHALTSSDMLAPTPKDED